MKIARMLFTVLLVSLLGCGCQPDNTTPSQPIEEQLAAIANAEINPVTPEEVAEAFALGSDSTDLQRDLINKELVGSVVEWRLHVYDVESEERLYKVTSQPLPIKSKEAVQLLRAVVFIVPSSKDDHELMRKLKTNDIVRIRGRVREIVLRTVVVIDSAVIVKGT